MDALMDENFRQALKKKFKDQNVTESIIPGGGTADLQPLDISINKLIKEFIRDQVEEH
jgi:hypothetical protein